MTINNLINTKHMVSNLDCEIYPEDSLTRCDGTEPVRYHRLVLSRRIWRSLLIIEPSEELCHFQYELLGNATVGFKNQMFTLAAEISPVLPALQHYHSVGPAVPGFLIGVTDRSSYRNAS